MTDVASRIVTDVMLTALRTRRRQMIVDASDLPESLRIQLQALEAARRRKRVGAGSVEIHEEDADAAATEEREVMAVVRLSSIGCIVAKIGDAAFPLPSCIYL